MRKHFINLEAWTTHLVVVGHPIQGFNKICSPFKDHFLSRKKKDRCVFLNDSSFLIFSHDSILILLAILCQGTTANAVAWGPQNGGKLPIYPCSHTHLIVSKGEHHWYSIVWHRHDKALICLLLNTIAWSFTGSL